MPFSRPQLVLLACVVVMAVLTLVMALRGSRGMWFSFVAMLGVLGMAWNWRRNSGSK